MKPKKKPKFKSRLAREKNGQELTQKQLNKKYSRYVKECDKEFSLYIRERDKDEDGWVNCTFGVSFCKKRVRRDSGRDCNCCHYIGRACWELRRDEKNCNAGCSGCNAFDDDHKIRYNKFMKEKYGVEEVEKLEFIARQINKKPKIYDLIDILSSIKAKRSQLANI